MTPTEITELQESGFTFEEIQDIQAGLDDIDHGRYSSRADVFARLAKRTESKILANA